MSLYYTFFCSVSSLIDCNNNKIVCVFFSVDCRVSSINSLKNVLKLFLSIFSVGMGAILDESHPYYINEYHHGIPHFC